MHLGHLGWGGVGGKNVHVNLKICHATLWDLLLHLHSYVMLRCGIFSCTCTMHICVWWVGDRVGWGMLTFHEHYTLSMLLLHLHTYVMLCCGIFSCTCTHTSCYAVGSSLALALCIFVFGGWGMGWGGACYPYHEHYTFFRPGLLLAPALCLVFSNFDLNLLISTAALELQLSKRCPTWPHPRHVRGIRSSTLSMLNLCYQSKVCST